MKLRLSHQDKGFIKFGAAAIAFTVAAIGFMVAIGSTLDHGCNKPHIVTWHKPDGTIEVIESAGRPSNYKQGGVSFELPDGRDTVILGGQVTWEVKKD